ncbi:pyrimidine dimer DNA glycosylase/endonuclease V [Jeotgalicoccus halotolerans]|uniref:Uncharacterized protein n=1 Tax=Jeotgalicoccus halotolerans TaxID=157227 RepID=A0A3E0AUM0_9STAP|nr:pyrimidine dimer DNA glycosylase/endonuclease V [Jeotgalicoccus halotolerans]REG23466.1 hypothetical protein DFR63_1842 [Jeotgalicoccus halotolerans]
MQIFRVHENHKISAQFLDNRRLSKQVLEMYQIIRVCLGAMDIIDTNTRYLSHPIVKSIYNEGHPYLIDAHEFLQILDNEHQRRGGIRSAKFRKDLDALQKLIDIHAARFNSNKIPPYFVYGDEKIHGKAVYKRYEELLFTKWQKDKIPPRCSLKLNRTQIL